MLYEMHVWRLMATLFEVRAVVSTDYIALLIRIPDMCWKRPWRFSQTENFYFIFERMRNKHFGAKTYGMAEKFAAL
jgi:hypothetical protein